MARTPDWLPRNHEKLLTKGTLIYNYIILPANRARMGFAAESPQGTWFDDNYAPNLTRLKNAYKAWEDPATRTKIMIADLKSAEKAFIPLIRQLYKSFLRDSPLVTEHDLAAMELPARPDGLRKPVPLPASLPIPTQIDSTTRRLVIRYADSLTGKKARPPHVREALIFWQVFPAQQAEVTLADLVHTTSNNTTPFTANFTDEQRAHYFYFAMQWVNTENKGGPTA